MNNVVYFKNKSKLTEALSYFNMTKFTNESVPVKLHMGEEKNKFFIRPDFVKDVVQQLLKNGAHPFLYDTTVLYNSPRKYVSGYIKVASIHGFNEKMMGCPIKIDEDGVNVDVEGYTFEVGKTLYNLSHIVCLSHVKGHVATGMGGAIKNIGMGGVTKNSKKMMHHGSKPLFQRDLCQFCGICGEVCPFDAVSVIEDQFSVKNESCFGCGVCVENCPSKALNYVTNNLQYLLACATKACIQNKVVLYINDVNRIADTCDCDPWAKKTICPDIGYLVSTDPVAIDHASLTLIDERKKDVFEKTHHVNPYNQVEYGEQIGLGSRLYDLIRI